jgi:hypothetical protein
MTDCTGHPVNFTDEHPGPCPGCGKTVRFVGFRCQVDGSEGVTLAMPDAEEHAPCRRRLEIKAAN